MWMIDRRFVLLLGFSTALPAETPSYQLDFQNHSDNDPPLIGVWLKNDRMKPIDAFTFNYQCPDDSVGSRGKHDRLSEDVGISSASGYPKDEKTWTPPKRERGRVDEEFVFSCRIPQDRKLKYPATEHNTAESNGDDRGPHAEEPQPSTAACIGVGSPKPYVGTTISRPTIATMISTVKSWRSERAVES